MAYVLMIDDNPQTRKYVEKIFHYRSKHELGFATSASEAIECLVERRPDVILLDLFIPGMDGIELFHSIRNHPATQSIPFIVHTAVELDQLTQLRLKRVRFEGFVQFPIAASELNAIIATALKRNEVSTKKWVPPAV
ncbi:MAG: response regulator [Gemmatimonadetes bacterium]|nr:response regulator [Gemmatimonadota bacterium]MBT6144952.1 response regulator [Gemmatimonadota bacterium]MBT7863385.1 response regulator [Gemmatimonadota bacterium]